MTLLLLALCIFETISRVFCLLMVNILEVNLFSSQIVNWMTSESIVRESDHKIHNTVIYNKYLNAGIKNFPRQKNEVWRVVTGCLLIVSRATTLVIRYESILEPLKAPWLPRVCVYYARVICYYFVVIFVIPTAKMINKTETPTTTKSNIIKEKKHKKKEKRAKDTPKAADDNTAKIENTPKAEDENAIKIGEVSEPPSERNVSQCNKKYTTRYNRI